LSNSSCALRADAPPPPPAGAPASPPLYSPAQAPSSTASNTDGYVAPAFRTPGFIGCLLTARDRSLLYDFCQYTLILTFGNFWCRGDGVGHGRCPGRPRNRTPADAAARERTFRPHPAGSREAADRIGAFRLLVPGAGRASALHAWQRLRLLSDALRHPQRTGEAISRPARRGVL